MIMYVIYILCESPDNVTTIYSTRIKKSCVNNLLHNLQNNAQNND